MNQFGGRPDLLNGWKEISAYLHHGVRTVQRWETERELPVRRPHGRAKSAVVAFRGELDQWVHSRNGGTKNGHPQQPGPGIPAPNMCSVVRGTIQQTQAERKKLAQIRGEFHQSLQALARRLCAMLPESAKDSVGSH